MLRYKYKILFLNPEYQILKHLYLLTSQKLVFLFLHIMNNMLNLYQHHMNSIFFFQHFPTVVSSLGFLRFDTLFGLFGLNAILITVGWKKRVKPETIFRIPLRRHAPDSSERKDKP